METEQWKPVEINNGVFSTRYEVSSLGRVRANPASKIKGSKPGRILFIGTDNSGYKQVSLHHGAKRKTTIKLHRLVAEAFLGERPVGFTVNHINGNKADNCSSNLEWLSNKDNCRHAIINIRNKAVEIAGQTMTLGMAVEKFGGTNVTEKCARRRINRLKWSIYDAITIPQQPPGRPKKSIIKTRAQQQAAWG